MRKAADILTSYAPLFTAGLLFASISKSALYYWQFNISITQFLDISEVLVLFFDSTLITSAILAGFAYIGLYSVEESFLGSHTNHYHIEKWRKKKAKNRRVYFFISLVSPSTVFLLTSFDDAIPYFIFSELLAIITCLTFFICDIVIDHGNHVSFEAIKQKHSIYAAAVAILFYVFYSSSGVLNAIITKRNSSARTNAIAFLENGGRVSTNDSFVYIGRTSKYLFFYNVRSSRATALASDKVFELKLK